MSFAQFIQILKARWVVTFLTLLLVAGSVIGISMVLPKQYTATASVILDHKPDPVSIAFTGGAMSPAYVATQIDIINSDRVSRRVIRALKLTDSEDTRARWREATEGKGDFEGWLADSLQRSLDVRPSRESNVISISFTGADPRFATILANGFVQAYVDTTLDLRVDPAKQYSVFFETRSKKLREDLEKAQSRLSAFQKNRSIFATDERIDVETQRLNELSAQLVAAQGMAADSQSRQVQARSNGGEQLVEVMNNPLVAGLKSDLNRAETRLQEVSSRLGENHPQVAELKAYITDTRQKLDSETRRVSGSVSITHNVNRGRENEIRSQVEAQRAKVLKFKETRDEMMVLQRDVENAQRSYDGVLARLAQTSMESQTTQTNVTVLTPAVEPSKPSSPRVILNGILGIFFGLLLGIGLSLMIELRNRRVRGPEDIVNGLGLPILGSMQKPEGRRIFRREAQPLLMQRVLKQLPQPSPKGA